MTPYIINGKLYLSSFQILVLFKSLRYTIEEIEGGVRIEGIDFTSTKEEIKVASTFILSHLKEMLRARSLHKAATHFKLYENYKI